MEHKRKYRFGGVVFEVNSPVPLREKDAFNAFLTEDEADFIYEIYDRGPKKEGQTTADVTREGKTLRVYMDASRLPDITVANFLSSVDAAHLLPEKSRFVLHCSYVELDGRAVLITAPSGTGKSTLARHFRDNLGARIVNEDRAIVYSENGEYYAAGCWAMGSGDTCLNATAPLRAVVILSQGSENRSLPIGAAEKLSKIVPQCTFNEKSLFDRVRIIDEASKLVAAVSVVSYECVNAPSAAFELEKLI